ncbi:conserved unknown protein [Ectocarpus siliculosus]|uniref:Uncharacterized protein n=1 Tax=Ectocarpus siliculosus TaxID=2880 RepID=D7G5Q2_ECTSI|nr:conserved unknown protein [Ectocarpus siliculosus]|eukprot:CBJ27349.1 conserved unknown protein [Ectocarpus siliculosus]
MERNGVEEMNQLGGSGGTIQLALDALKEKKGSVDQVVDYCESSYLEPGANKREVWLRTEEYLKDALGSVVADIEDMAINLLTFVNAQAEAVEKVTSDVVIAKTRLNRAREQSAATRLLELRRAAGETPARQKIVVLTGSERPTKCRPLPPRRRISLKEKLGGIYADEPPSSLSLASDSGTLPGSAAAGLGDAGSVAETADMWGEHNSSPSSSRVGGISDLPSPSVGGDGGGSPRSFKPDGSSASPAASPREAAAGGGDSASKKDRLDLAAAARKAVAPVPVPTMAPPPPARDPVVMNKRLSAKQARPAGGAVGAPPPLVSRAKPGAPPPLLSQAGRGSSMSSVSSRPEGGSKPLPPPPPPQQQPPASSLFSVPEAQTPAPPLPPPPPPPKASSQAAASPPPPPPPPPPVKQGECDDHLIFFGCCWCVQSVSRYDELACESVGFAGSLFLISRC